MKSNRILILLTLITIASAFFFSSCDNRTLKPQDYRITAMWAVPDTIYQDNNITFSEIFVKVKDADNFAVIGETVTFRSNIGNILTRIPTDSTGVAKSTFWDNGDIGTAYIDAFISDKKSTVNVQINNKPEIENLTIMLNSNTLNVADVTTVRVFAQNSLGNVPNGTLILLTTTEGFFQNAEGIELGTNVQIATSNGIAKTFFNAGQKSGSATLTAFLSGVQDSAIVQIQPGNPRYMYLTSEVGSVEANSNQEILISAQVEDTYHNPVRSNIGVSFSTDLGTVGQIGYTDAFGIATTMFSPGITAGLATISAVADSAQASTVISITSNDVYSIVFNFQQQVDIQIQGTGGNESFEFRVNLYDRNGNLIDFSQQVFFKFVNAPVGTNINDLVFYPSDESVSVLATNGYAVCSVSSGTVSGTVALRAYTFDQNGNEKFATKSNIVIHAGPANSISITNPGYDSAVNVGGGQWQMEIAAIITDEYANGVDYGTAVFFSLLNNPSWAYIGAVAYVGNQNTNGDSLTGTAFTKLTFDGSHTNDTVSIRVEVPNTMVPGTVFVDIINIVLKGQFLDLDMIVVPQHIDWVAGTATTQTAYVTIEVYDQQTNPIANQSLYVFSDYGNPATGTSPSNYIYTTNANGVINLQWHYYRWEVPEPLDQAVSISATITAQILGPGTSESVTVILRRYP
jgi:hypothetical protein